jgi:hypothetical protein
MKLIYICLLSIIPSVAISQVGKKGSINISSAVDLLLPSANLALTHNYGYGFSLKAEYVFAHHISTTLSGSFLNFPGDKVQNLQLVPVFAGLRYYLGNFYLGAEAGTGIEIHPGKSNNFIYAFSLGDEIVTGRHGNSLDISLRITNWEQEVQQRFYGLRLAYEFRIR